MRLMQASQCPGVVVALLLSSLDGDDDYRVATTRPMRIDDSNGNHTNVFLNYSKSNSLENNNDNNISIQGCIRTQNGGGGRF